METKKIEAKNLEKQYVLKEKTGLFRSKNKKIVQAVKGVSLEIPKGKIVGVSIPIPPSYHHLSKYIFN